MQKHLPQVIQIVHGSELTKEALFKEIRKSIPEIGRSTKLKRFLSNNLVRQSVGGKSKKRQFLQLDRLSQNYQVSA